MPGPRLIALFLAIIAFAATPAPARAVSVDAPGDVMLFGLGIVGLLVGRHVSKRRKNNGSDKPG